MRKTITKQCRIKFYNKKVEIKNKTWIVKSVCTPTSSEAEDTLEIESGILQWEQTIKIKHLVQASTGFLAISELWIVTFFGWNFLRLNLIEFLKMVKMTCNFLSTDFFFIFFRWLIVGGKWRCNFREKLFWQFS